jgi:biotin carboxyl carrier protein
MNYVVSLEDESFEIGLRDGGEIVVDGEAHTANMENAGGTSLYSLLVDNSSYEVHVEEREGTYRVLLLGQRYDIRVEDEGTRRVSRARKEARPSEDAVIVLKSPIPGLIFDVPVTEGQEVKQGDILVIVEAMKMENELRAPRDGAVKATFVVPGDSVDKGQPLVTLS